MSPDAFFPIGIKIYSDIEELYIEGVLPAKLKEIEPLAEEGIPSFSRERLQDLSFFYEEFYRWVAASGLFDPFPPVSGSFPMRSMKLQPCRLSADFLRGFFRLHPF